MSVTTPFRLVAHIVSGREHHSVEAAEHRGGNIVSDVIQRDEGERGHRTCLRLLAPSDRDVLAGRAEMKGRVAADDSGSADNEDAHQDTSFPAAGRALLPLMTGMLVQVPRSSRYQPAAASAPPSAWTTVPVTHPASSLARKMTQPALSAGRPKRPSGIQRGMLWRCDSWIIRSSGTCAESVVSGATAFTRIPSGPSSSARLMVKPVTAALNAPEGTKPGMPRNPSIEETVTMLAGPFACLKSGNMVRVTRKTCLRFTR